MCWLANKMKVPITRWLGGRESICQCRRRGFEPCMEKTSWGKKWQLAPVFLPREPMDKSAQAAAQGPLRVRRHWGDEAWVGSALVSSCRVFFILCVPQPPCVCLPSNTNRDFFFGKKRSWLALGESEELATGIELNKQCLQNTYVNICSPHHPRDQLSTHL